MEENSFEMRLKQALEIEMESPRKIPVTTKKCSIDFYIDTFHILNNIK